MKKIKRWILLGIISFLMCACSFEDENKQIGTSSNTSIPTPEENEIGEKNIEFEMVNWEDLECFVDEETSRRNSNFLNYGYLTYDTNGNIYYIDKNNQNDIYVSDYKGGNKRLLCENCDTSGWMQVVDDWLYYCTKKTAIMRINIKTGKQEQICDEYSGHFRIEGGRVYWDDRSQGGFSSVELDGSNVRLEQDTSAYYIGFYSQGNDFWILEADSKATNSSEKYIIKLDGEKITCLEKQGYYPLLAGKYLSIVDAETNLRHIWNMETKEDFNTNAWTDQTVVSDGKIFYYKEMKVIDSTPKPGKQEASTANVIYKWDGETAEEIWIIDSIDLYHMFLTPKALYCMPQMNIDGKYGYHLLYYDLETGATGQIY